jgi:hypothetical protein
MFQLLKKLGRRKVEKIGVYLFQNSYFTSNLSTSIIEKELLVNVKGFKRAAPNNSNSSCIKSTWAVSDGVNRPEQFFSDQFWCMSKSAVSAAESGTQTASAIDNHTHTRAAIPMQCKPPDSKTASAVFWYSLSLSMLCDDKKTRARDCVSSHFLITRSSLLPWQSE